MSCCTEKNGITRFTDCEIIYYLKLSTPFGAMNLATKIKEAAKN